MTQSMVVPIPNWLMTKKWKIKIHFWRSKIFNKSSGKKILNKTFYPDQKGLNKFIKGKSELKGNKQVKTKNFKLENAQKYR